eukprot:TRINITY_DN4436_c0_g1_i1.p1 TRINITY_DN4436_c0_g1~~TRINITY_DN4436_c0_g1_i1.p1  ORF type:complete len:112 (+),score=11.92 TRINITY_DN4436_c0_g1_i1:125-460(+)
MRHITSTIVSCKFRDGSVFLSASNEDKLQEMAAIILRSAAEFQDYHLRRGIWQHRPKLRRPLEAYVHDPSLSPLIEVDEMIETFGLLDLEQDEDPDELLAAELLEMCDDFD